MLIAVTHVVPRNFIMDCVRDLATADGCPAHEEVEREHEAYRDALRSLGLEVHVGEFEEPLADAIFAHDPVAIFGSGERKCLVLLNMGRDSRKPEVDAWRQFYARLLPGHWEMRCLYGGGATAEGGDIAEAEPRQGLRLERSTYFVGLSKRTNQAGIAALREIAAEFSTDIVPVQVSDECLHLETGVTVLDHRVVADASWVDLRPFCRAGYQVIEAVEKWSANVQPIHLGDRTVIIASRSFPQTNDRLRRQGFEVIDLKLDGAFYAQGGPSCLARIIDL